MGGMVRYKCYFSCYNINDATLECINQWKLFKQHCLIDLKDNLGSFNNVIRTRGIYLLIIQRGAVCPSETWGLKTKFK